MSINIARKENAVNKFRENLDHKQTETKTQTQTDAHRPVSERRLKAWSVPKGSTTKTKTYITNNNNNSYREKPHLNRDRYIS